MNAKRTKYPNQDTNSCTWWTQAIQTGCITVIVLGLTIPIGMYSFSNIKNTLYKLPLINNISTVALYMYVLKYIHYWNYSHPFLWSCDKMTDTGLTPEPPLVSSGMTLVTSNENRLSCIRGRSFKSNQCIHKTVVYQMSLVPHIFCASIGQQEA